MVAPRPWTALRSVPVFQDHNLGPLFLPSASAAGAGIPWLLPQFRARVLYSVRLAVSALLACVWVFNDDAALLFTPGILIPVACVRVHWLFRRTRCAAAICFARCRCRGFARQS